MMCLTLGSRSLNFERGPLDFIVLHHIAGPFHAQFFVKRNSVLIRHKVDRDVLFSPGNLMRFFS